LALNQIDPETGFQYHIDVEQLSYNPLDWREWGFDNMTNINDPISVVKESCPNDGLKHVYIKWTSFPRFHEDTCVQTFNDTILEADEYSGDRKHERSTECMVLLD